LNSIQSSQPLPLSWRGLIVIAGLFAVVSLQMSFGVPNVDNIATAATAATAAAAVAATATTSVRTAATTARAAATTSVRTAATTCNKIVGGDNQKSQNGEDGRLLAIFNGLCGGRYLEMGAFDGIRHSNTHVFNKALGWKGLLIEAGPTSFHKLTQNRPNELALVHAAVCKDSKQTMHYVEQWNHAANGIWELASPSFRERWWKGLTIEQTSPIQCIPLESIIEENVAGSPAYFDIFSLDVEGAEFEALSSLDFSKAAFGIVLVEMDDHNLRKNMAVRAILERHGYTFWEHSENSQWFFNKDFDTIYQEVVYEFTR
jgi:FkbM family methyltransferase